MIFSTHLPLISWTEKGLYCEAGGFYIDPHRAVELAIVTHAHSDHARKGCGRYITVKSGADLLRIRLGKKIDLETVSYGQIFQLGEVKVSLHSAGHILGSAQVRVERGNDVWVASGDYKREPDLSCETFEAVPCNTFITEATFGTPGFCWPENPNHGKDISKWWDDLALQKGNALLFGYSLGKAQRILAELAPYAKRPVLIHSTIEELTECYRNQGVALAPTRSLKAMLADSQTMLEGELILAPPSVLKEEWADRLGKHETAFASGWMSGNRNFGGAARHDRGFVMSDHADWKALNRTIMETGARRVFVQHRNGALIRHLRKNGLEAHPVGMLVPEKYQELQGWNLDLFEDLS